MKEKYLIQMKLSLQDKYFVVIKYKNSILKNSTPTSFKIKVRENPLKLLKIYFKGELLIKYNLSKDKIYD